MDHQEICEPSLDRCSNPWGNDNVEQRSQYFIRPPNSVQNPLKPASSTTTETDRAHTLLSIALYNSWVGANVLGLEATSHVNGMIALDLPREQWKFEAKQWFEASLARMQMAVVDTARGTPHNIKFYSYAERLVNYQDICNMVKVRTIGWRNVSVWGLLGLLSLAALISLSSFKTADDQLLLTIALRMLVQAPMEALSLIKRIPWAQGWTIVWCLLAKFYRRLRKVHSSQ